MTRVVDAQYGDRPSDFRVSLLRMLALRIDGCEPAHASVLVALSKQFRELLAELSAEDELSSGPQSSVGDLRRRSWSRRNRNN